MALTGRFISRGVSILCVVVILIVGSGRHSSEAIRLRNEPITVRMINVLGPGLDLTVHCKQRNQDLGVHLVHPNQTYEFTFRPNFWLTSLYFCTFSWPGECHWFEIFTMDRDHDRPICNWQIRKDKPCRLGKKSNAFDDCFEWNLDKC